MGPKAEQMPLPPEYGSPSEVLEWPQVEERLASATVYWLATVRSDGRPHVVPRDGVWLHGGLFYGGSDQTVHSRNVRRDPRVAFHVGEGLEAVIVEGEASFEMPSDELAQALAASSFEKYPQYGRIDPSSYSTGAWFIRPVKVLAWTNLPENATRFTFG